MQSGKDEELRISVRVSGETGVHYGNEPLTFGVPFAEGTFPAGSRLRAVRADGCESPLQTSEVATWQKDRRNVKWLVADLRLFPSKELHDFILAAAEYGKRLEWAEDEKANPTPPLPLPPESKERVSLGVLSTERFAGQGSSA